MCSSKSYSTTETQRSQSSEDFLIKTSLLCALCASAVSFLSYRYFGETSFYRSRAGRLLTGLELNAEQPRGVFAVDGATLRIAQLQCFEVLQLQIDILAEGNIGAEHNMVYAEHRERHAQSGNVAAHRVVVKTLEVSLGRRAEIFAASGEALVAPLNPPPKIRREAAEVRKNHLQFRVALEDAGKHQARRGQRGLEHETHHVGEVQLQHAVEPRRRD